MDITLIRSIAELGLGPLIAIIIIYWNRTDAREREARQQKESDARVQEAKSRAAQERDDKILLINTMRDVTEALTELKVFLQEKNGKS